MDHTDRYQLTHFSGTLGGPLVRASADKPKSVYDAGRWLEKEGGRDVRIWDRVAGKDYDLDAFAKEYKLK